MPEYKTGTLQIVPAGKYEFRVKSAREKVSSKGNAMIELQLLIGENGPIVFDNLVFLENSTWKVDDFRRSTGETFPSGQIVSFEAEDCVDRSGRVELNIETFQGVERNKVERYIVERNGQNPPAQPADPDDILF
jgi:hypothetical protein